MIVWALFMCISTAHGAYCGPLEAGFQSQAACARRAHAYRTLPTQRAVCMKRRVDAWEPE